jgi:formylglycine-generating enzyme required for sulfatase activity
VSAQERRLPGRRDDRAGPNIADRIAPPPSIGSFGLHDVHGNVAEWCRDWKLDYDRASARNGDGLLLLPPPMRPPAVRAVRGGSAAESPVQARCSARAGRPPQVRERMLGLRPVRAIGRGQ